ncbi:recombination protein RecR [Treponema phagedenis]|uniref:Recombination protein RecR n=1 Tax=Treponema phagedenis TaxID=162 RepID=A0A0B7GYQ1_TREPH|nr:recombination mediator RecR [Treponema phagedenis]EFW38588.1 recombination protein RecR [Treponema phagedenis F0421]NVP24280.1 recombination protein RecR [Treponema phagedenis]QEJ94250.1 recombination protein RecR [Treponema phagedenis]QEJ99124.1 recombination protein RecR [Treponema phagedenis]QEK00208.1 recombination protein RecR [Treponema phagedenis]
MNALDDLIDNFSRLPGIGKKSAMRLAYHLLKRSPTEAQALAKSILMLHEKIHPCSVCGAFTDQDLCLICADPLRDTSTICVVEQPQDVETVAAVAEYNGLFHVLGGVIAPLEGVGPDQLRIGELIKRIQQGNIKEIILATNPTIEGDTTALYLQKILQDFSLTVSRLASGLPVGGDLEYTDRLTLARSFRGRINLSS